MGMPIKESDYYWSEYLTKNWKALDGKTYPQKMECILQQNKDFLSKYHEEFDYEFVDA